MYAIGLMSGTSLDGIDVALVKINNLEKGGVNLIDFLTIPYSDEVKAKINSACHKGSSQEICSLNFELGYLFAEAVKRICEKANVTLDTIDYIASHGQTIYHIPKVDGYFKSTLQIGEPAVIAYETGIPVISNFRVMDIAAGGEGAPLVPFVDYTLFNNNEGCILLNIGGISNITVIPPNASLSDVQAFDTGPGNMVIDGLMRHFYKLQYDSNGEIAASGLIDQSLLSELMAMSYFDLDIPKSTGRELFGKKFLDDLIRQSRLEAQDLLATLTAFTAKSITDQIKKFVNCPIKQLIISGGGIHNDFLIKLIEDQVEIPIHSIESFGITADAKEAIAFTILGYRTIHGKTSNVPAATGANKDVVLGTITPVPYIE